MTSQLNIAMADTGGLFWFIIVVITIISQIIRLSKRGGAPRPDSRRPPTPAPFPGANKDLSDFLESLTGAPIERQPPPPRPEAQEPGPPPPPLPRVSVTPPASAAAPVRAVQARARQPVAVAPATAERGLAPKAAGKRLKVFSQLRSPTSLRRAVVLREILGSPLGLRSPGSQR